MREFERDYDVLPAARAATACCTRCSTLTSSGAGRASAPRIAILDWREVPTLSEFVLFQRLLRARMGIECVIADPRELEYRDGKLMAGGRAASTSSTSACCITRAGRARAASTTRSCGRCATRAVCMVNPFRCKILHKKASLAVLSDERNAALFDADEQRARSRRTSPGRAWWRSGTTDVTTASRSTCCRSIAREHGQLVLKPNDDYGGPGIVLGWTVDAAEWEAAVQTRAGRAVHRPGAGRDPVGAVSRAWSTARCGVVDRMLDTAPFVCVRRVHATAASPASRPPRC